MPRLAALCNHADAPTAELIVVNRSTLRLVATRDLKRGEAITLDYCPFSATAEHRAAVLAPFFLEELARAPLVADPPEVFDDFIPENRRRRDGDG